MTAPSKRTFVAWAGIVWVIVAGFIAGGLSIRNSLAASFDTAERVYEARGLAFHLIKVQLDEETGVRGFAMGRDRELLQPYEDARYGRPAPAPALEGMLDALGLPQSADRIADADRTNRQWLRIVASSLIAGRVRNPRELEKKGNVFIDRVREDASSVNADLAARLKEARNDVDTAMSRITFLILAMASLLVVAAFEFNVLQQRSFSRLRRERRQSADAEKRAHTARLDFEAATQAASALHESASSEQRDNAATQLHQAAFCDALTGLPNRAYFLDRLSSAIALKKINPELRVTLLFLDVDRFKTINASLGHPAGDRILTDIAHRLAACLRRSDMLARLGSDEFSILLGPDMDTHDACSVASRILAALAKPFRVDDQSVLVTASIGIAADEPECKGASGMLRDADVAMFHAKSLGGSRYVIFAQDMSDQIVARSQLEMDLRGALLREELSLLYQPIVSLATGRIAGFEALARWHHPKRGTISPVEFIPLAEETGLIVPLGAWALDEACRQAVTWQNIQPPGLPVRVNVNVSAHQLISKSFAAEGLGAEVRAALMRSGLDAGCLNLEITESGLLDYAEATEAALRYIRSLGVSMQLDDFGTGYSSLSYLQRLPIDTVKIDLSFVSGKPGQGISNPQIVQAIVALARKLGKRVTAEGVETEKQLRQLQALRCTSGQGYYFSRPLDADGARAFLADWKPFVGFDLLPTAAART
jgi:diguanylate cyclase (GGDEF)-like protein